MIVGTLSDLIEIERPLSPLKADIQVVDLFSWLPIPLRPFPPPHGCTSKM